MKHFLTPYTPMLFLLLSIIVGLSACQMQHELMFEPDNRRQDPRLMVTVVLRDGQPYQRFEYQQRKLSTRITYSANLDSLTERWQYNEQGRPSRKSLFDAQGVEREYETYEYNNRGALLKTIHYKVVPSDWTRFERHHEELFYYDTQSRLVRREYYHAHEELDSPPTTPPQGHGGHNSMKPGAGLEIDNYQEFEYDAYDNITLHRTYAHPLGSRELGPVLVGNLRYDTQAPNERRRSGIYPIEVWDLSDNVVLEAQYQVVNQGSVYTPFSFRQTHLYNAYGYPSETTRTYHNGHIERWTYQYLIP